jgi:hypothetical protein
MFGTKIDVPQHGNTRFQSKEISLHFMLILIITWMVEAASVAGCM